MAHDKAERFEDLRIWQEARELSGKVYRKTERLPDRSFANQIRRAASSTMNNIAEGFERRTDADFAHFLDVAKGSCGEVRSMFYLGEDLEYFRKKEAEEIRAFAVRLSRGISKLASYLRKPPDDKK